MSLLFRDLSSFIACLKDQVLSSISALLGVLGAQQGAQGAFAKWGDEWTSAATAGASSALFSAQCPAHGGNWVGCWEVRQFFTPQLEVSDSAILPLQTLKLKAGLVICNAFYWWFQPWDLPPPFSPTLRAQTENTKSKGERSQSKREMEKLLRRMWPALTHSCTRM